MRWIIASTNSVPEATGTGKVNGELGPWLARQGDHVEVTTAPPYYPQEDVQEPYSASRYETEQLDGVVVHRVHSAELGHRGAQRGRIPLKPVLRRVS